MRRRIVLLVAATTSAVVVGFLVPMCLLIINLANDRAESQAREQAQLVAGLIASVPDDTTLAAAVSSISRAGLVVTVVRADEDLIGASSLTDDTRTSVQRARKDRQPFTATLDHGLDAVVPVTTTNGVDVVIATVPSGQVNRGVPAAITTICTIGALLIVGATLLARQLARRVTTPVTAVAATAHRLREGELTARARVGGPPETVELATALNALAERIEDLLDAERERVADLGHRLRTPVTALRLDSELIDDDEVAGRFREHVDHLQRSIDHVVRDARRNARHDVKRRCDVAAVARDRVDWWLPLAEDQGRELRLVIHRDTGGVGAWVTADAVDLTEALDCLIDNAFAYTAEGVALQVEVLVDDGWVVLTVEDGGPGAPEDAAERGRSGSGSSGLGLSIVRRVVEGAGGTLTLGRSGALGGLRAEARCPAPVGIP